jgi:hypothetical protein
MLSAINDSGSVITEAWRNTSMLNIKPVDNSLSDASFTALTKADAPEKRGHASQLNGAGAAQHDGLYASTLSLGNHGQSSAMVIDDESRPNLVLSMPQSKQGLRESKQTAD